MAFAVGTTRRGKTLSLSDEERSRHVHIVGASGTGKSKLMESMIRQDILAGRGLCLIDPHGTLADAIVQFCASRNLQGARRIHVVKPADAAWSVGFNPLRLDGVTEAAARVDAMVSACAQVWGGENPSKPVRVFPVAILLPQGDYELKEALDSALTEMLTNGEIEAILKKYEKTPGSFYRVAPPYQVPSSTQ